MKPVEVKDIDFQLKLNTYIDSIELHSNKEVNDKDPKNVKLVIMQEFLNTKISLLKDTHQIDLRRFL